MSDEYRIVSAKLLGRTPKAIKVATKQGNEWLPRSLLHAADDLKVDKLSILVEFSFRLRAWKAEEVGLS